MIDIWVWRHPLEYCTDRECEVERGCCKKRKLTLVMTSQILQWLKEHQVKLSSGMEAAAAAQRDANCNIM